MKKNKNADEQNKEIKLIIDVSRAIDHFEKTVNNEINKQTIQLWYDFKIVFNNLIYMYIYFRIVYVVI